MTDKTRRGGLPAATDYQRQPRLGSGKPCAGCNETMQPTDVMFTVTFFAILRRILEAARDPGARAPSPGHPVPVSRCHRSQVLNGRVFRSCPLRVRMRVYGRRAGASCTAHAIPPNNLKAGIEGRLDEDHRDAISIERF